MAYEIEGRLLEVCTCNVLCPCWVGEDPDYKTCDTTIDLSSDPPGLVVQEAVFAPGDAHCCPSSTKTSVLTFDETTGWTVESTTEQPT